MKFVFSLYRLKLTQVQRTPTEFRPPCVYSFENKSVLTAIYVKCHAIFGFQTHSVENDGPFLLDE